MKPLPPVQIFIMTHNRPELVMETVESALAIDYPSFQVVVSDNSDDGDGRTREAFRRFRRGNLKYIRRKPCLSNIGHSSTILRSMMDSDLFVLFHDDDLFHRDFLKRTVAVAMAYPELVAVGTNMRFIDNGVKSRHSFMAEGKELVIWRSHKALLDRMMNQAYFHAGNGFAMISGHLFRKSKLDRLTSREELGGKYSDLAFLTEVCRRGPVAWILEPLWFYRHHSGQDGDGYSLGDSLMLLEYYCRTMGFSRKYSNRVDGLRRKMFEHHANNLVRMFTASKIHLMIEQALVLNRKVVLFPVGKHTARILESGGLRKDRIILCDDNPASLARYRKAGWRCALGDRVKAEDYSLALLSSDNDAISEGLRKRANALFGRGGWRDMYDIMPGGKLVGREWSNLIERAFR